MENTSANTLGHENSNSLTKANTIATNTNATKGTNNLLNLHLIDTSITQKGSVRAEPLRTNFRKSNTCGSLFAKCKCNNHVHHHNTVIPLISEICCDSVSQLKLERNNRKTQSFCHPDTPVIFTEENRYPSLAKIDWHRTRLRTSHDALISTGKQKIEIKHSKRASSPNLYATDGVVDIHPEFQVQVKSEAQKAIIDNVDKNNPSLPSPSSVRRSFLKKPSKSLPYPDHLSSSYRFDTIECRTPLPLSCEDFETNEEAELTEHAVKTNSFTTVADVHVNYDSYSKPDDGITFCPKSPSKNIAKEGNITAENYLQATKEFLKQSGILGPMGNVSSILKKSSRIKPILSNPHTREQIRKTSLVLFGNRENDIKKKRSISESHTQYPLNESDLSSISLHEEVRQLKETIQSRDLEIGRLRREIHKLKSVLHQQSKRNLQCNCNLPSTQVGVTRATLTENVAMSSLTSISSAPHAFDRSIHNIKKQGVSGESCESIGHSSTILVRKYEKDFQSKQQIKDAISENDFLKHLDCIQVRELVESMYSLDVNENEYVIRENEPGDHLYVSAEGEFEIEVSGRAVGTLMPGKAFGELAILYNCRRTASIKAIKPKSRVWVLDRRAFQSIMLKTGLQRIEENVTFLKSVPLLMNLSEEVLSKIADVLELEFYPSDAYIIRQGARGDTFFLISQGSVKVTQRIPGSTKEEEIRTLSRGDYFGEQALIKEDKRTANIIAMSPGVECLTLDRESFNQHIGDLIELHEKDYGDKDRIYAIKNLKNKHIPITDRSEFPKEYENMELKDLVELAVIGIGGFGRVLLVKNYTNESSNIFALKQMKKVHILETKQEEHVFNERKIMLACADCPFICRLYRTFRDSKFIYLLMEACLGGEVWTVLRNQGRFSETTAQFIIGCVLEAFEYLHSRGIIYRDLKPENLMLTAEGYVKLVDFGFSKQIGYSNKTFTFCGTPEYVAPEIILNKGHDRAVDCWALGVLIFELITGLPPFTSNDPLKTYNLILKGIDAIEFPRHVSRSAMSLIKKLCRDVPTERLGYQRHGICDIRKQKWFQGFDFESLSNLSFKPPQITSVNGPLDLSNFDTFSSEFTLPDDENSGWDASF